MSNETTYDAFWIEEEYITKVNEALLNLINNTKLFPKQEHLVKNILTEIKIAPARDKTWNKEYRIIKRRTQKITKTQIPLFFEKEETEYLTELLPIEDNMRKSIIEQTG